MRNFDVETSIMTCNIKIRLGALIVGATSAY